MASLKYDFRCLIKHNRDGSHATQTARAKNLELMATQLKSLGYTQMRATKIKLKHVNALVNLWDSENLTAGTIKNRLSHLRWLSEKIDKSHMIPKNNDYFGVVNRVFVTNQDKSIRTPESVIKNVQDKRVNLSLRLQCNFGLRREESIKFNANFADKGDYLELKASWCKGGRSRQIPIETIEQRALINEIKNATGSNSLIPENKKYIDQLHQYNYQLRKEKISKAHGFRHFYAQKRYKDLTERLCPAGGGKTSKELTPAEKIADKQVRKKISSELGHNRENITAIYLGR